MIVLDYFYPELVLMKLLNPLRTGAQTDAGKMLQMFSSNEDMLL